MDGEAIIDGVVGGGDQQAQDLDGLCDDDDLFPRWKKNHTMPCTHPFPDSIMLDRFVHSAIPQQAVAVH